MKIEFIDLKKQYQSLKNELDGAIARVLDKGIFVLGEEEGFWRKKQSDHHWREARERCRYPVFQSYLGAG